MKPRRRQLRAGRLVADGILQQQEIARAVNVHRNTLARWLARPEFQAVIERIAAQQEAEEASGPLRQAKKKIVDLISLAQTQIIKQPQRAEALAAKVKAEADEILRTALAEARTEIARQERALIEAHGDAVEALSAVEEFGCWAVIDNPHFYLFEVKHSRCYADAEVKR